MLSFTPTTLMIPLRTIQKHSWRSTCHHPFGEIRSTHCHVWPRCVMDTPVDAPQRFNTYSHELACSTTFATYPTTHRLECDHMKNHRHQHCCAVSALSSKSNYQYTLWRKCICRRSIFSVLHVKSICNSHKIRIREHAGRRCAPLAARAPASIAIWGSIDRDPRPVPSSTCISMLELFD
jgi:hypothetical protein